MDNKGVIAGGRGGVESGLPGGAKRFLGGEQMEGGRTEEGREFQETGQEKLERLEQPGERQELLGEKAEQLGVGQERLGEGQEQLREDRLEIDMLPPGMTLDDKGEVVPIQRDLGEELRNIEMTRSKESLKPEAVKEINSMINENKDNPSELMEDYQRTRKAFLKSSFGLEVGGGS